MRQNYPMCQRKFWGWSLESSETTRGKYLQLYNKASFHAHLFPALIFIVTVFPRTQYRDHRHHVHIYHLSRPSFLY